ncbi:SIR2 family protein [Photobacterium atrarenae]|uniref:SIR2 family protein n=1 Tax=Photobacterium atrarenae TaxID=865757 RepID=A0ABY5GGV7_9GAMM|nr:SIR2 family protein [Photobacterium atrarenae]UTV28442.1 SIR2 family protein [Photobacterium atrarenae]
MSNIPKSLRDAIQSKQIIPFVGAGVSRSIKDKQNKQVFPGWLELLELAAKEVKSEGDLNNATLVETFLKIKDYQQAAKYAHQSLNGPCWVNFFKTIFTPNFNLLDYSSANLPKAIWKINKQIITLNYDKILQWAYTPSAQVSTLDNNSVAELREFQIGNNDNPIVWHLHGHIDNCAELILTPDGYNKLYATNEGYESKYKAALTTLKNLSVNKSFLFIGCSLDDAELLSEIHKQQNLFAENIGPHFALVHQDQESSIKEKLNGTNIKLITFEDFGEPLVHLIEELASYAPQEQSTIVIEQSKKEPYIKNKIALLSANPLDNSQQYNNLLKEFKKIPCQIEHFSLNVENLNNLQGYEYILILSKVINNRILIEDEHLCSRKISFEELETQIGNDDTFGVFIFVDQLPTNSNTETLKLPTLIIAEKEKKKLSSIAFQLFRKNNLEYFEQCQLLNSHQFTSFVFDNKFKCKNNITKKKTRLPDSIDPKTVRNFIGRTGDLEQICRKLISLEEESGALTIKGAGGIGKTTTVKKLSVELSERNYFEGGIHFIDCEFITDFHLFQYKVASTFNLEQAENFQDQLRYYHDGYSRLIILDNVETLLYIDDCKKIKDLIVFICDYASMVITSRERLKIEGEIVYEMRQFTTDEAVELFTSNVAIQDTSEDELLLLRHDIIEELLDNNPLAIELITNNIPDGKNLHTLKQELEIDLFSKISDDELETFSDKSDTNINRKKSIYASILYSYNLLNNNEKNAFELLSLFPDGIDLEQFKTLTRGKKNNKNYQKLIITDKVIKSLQNKSMLENNSGVIKLQSIVGKFADAQLAKRDNITSFYNNAFKYNHNLIEALDEIYYDKKCLALEVFDSKKSNFLKSISYFAKLEIDYSDLCNFVHKVCGFSTESSSLSSTIRIISENVDVFPSSYKQCIDVTLLSIRYYNGDFDRAFNELKQILPLESLRNFPHDNLEQRITASRARDLYKMEGDEFFSAKQCKDKQIFSRMYRGDLLCLGELDYQYANSCTKDFSTLEVLANLNMLSLEEIDNVLSSLYEKDHLERMQISYTRSKISPLTHDEIEPLVIVNPYTKGLKNLMLAFIESDKARAKKLYQESLVNLEHIKHYYVEALYLYTKFLKENNFDDFNYVFQRGFELAQKHHYRFLQHKFKQLTNPTNEEYNSLNYPLPDNVSFTDYIRKASNFNLKNKQK